MDDEGVEQTEALTTETEGEQLEKDGGKEVSFRNTDVSGSEIPNRTIFESFYEPKILSPWEDDRKSNKSQLRKTRTIKDQTIMLNDTNADRFGNVSRVGWKSRIQYALAEYDEENARMLATRHEIQQDPNRLLNITVATLIMLACKRIVPKEYFMLTELYLKSIQNEYGDRPQNIRNFLKYMRYLKRTKNYDWGEMSHVVPPENLVIAKIDEEDMKDAINKSIAVNNRSLNKSKIPVSKKDRSPQAKKLDKTRQPIEKVDEQKKEVLEPKQEKEEEKVEYFTNSPVTSDMFLAGGSFGDKFASTPKSSKTDM